MDFSIPEDRHWLNLDLKEILMPVTTVRGGGDHPDAVGDLELTGINPHPEQLPNRQPVLLKPRLILLSLQESLLLLLLRFLFL
jgi:hypothetical protein